MKFISLFSGIGGLDLGLERAGMECVAQVEIDPWCRTILAKHWPDIPQSTDVKEFHPDTFADAVVGGFPCQDVSTAGKRAGLAGARTGLFWEAMRIVDESRARWVILENVRGLLSSNGGEDFGTVLGALADRGFDAQWQLLPAAAFGAYHKRERLFLVAYHSVPGRGWGPLEERPEPSSDGPRQVPRSEWFPRLVVATDARRDPAARLGSEPDVERLVHGTTRGLDRKRVKAAGNGVYPAVAEYVGRAVMSYERYPVTTSYQLVR